jgi:hypothetical protein
MNQRRIESKTVPTFWLLAILIFQPAGIYVGIASGIPKLDEMAGEWLPMQKVANPPDVNNFHDMLLVNRDLTSFFCYPDDWLWSGQPRFGYPPVRLTVDGKEYPATGCRWYPYRALRRNLNCAGLAIETDTRMINEQRAVLLRVRITGSGATNKTQIMLSVSGRLQVDGVSILNTNQRPGFVTIFCPAQNPDAVTSDNGVVNWKWNFTLPKNGGKVIEVVAGDGRITDVKKISTQVARFADTRHRKRGVKAKLLHGHCHAD